MDGDSTGYVLVLMIGAGLAFLDGQILIRAGQGFLADVFAERRTAASLNTMLVAFFHLLVLGVLALVSTVDVSAESFLELIVKKVGLMMLVLAVAHALTIIVLARLRFRWREHELLEEVARPTVRTDDGPHVRLSERTPDVAPPQA